MYIIVDTCYSYEDFVNFELPGYGIVAADKVNWRYIITNKENVVKTINDLLIVNAEIKGCCICLPVY